MVRLACSVMLVSGGLAAIARALEGPHGGVAGPLLVMLGVGSVVGGVILLVLDRAKRSADQKRGRRRAWSRAGWDEASELDRMVGFEAAWERSERAFEPTVSSISRARIREASRSLLFSFESVAREGAHSRRALRSACRRSHVRAAASTRPKRHRVRPRPRLFM